MPKEIPEDKTREDRIINEIIVDAYGPEEQAMGWWCYLDDHLAFPFGARCRAARRISPLQVGEIVTVTGMAPEDDCMHEMFVIVKWQNRTFGVPLAQLEALEVDEDTAEALADWDYWLGRGYEL